MKVRCSMGIFGTGWEPHKDIVYRSWTKYSDSHQFRDFKVKVHIGDNEYEGSFSVGEQLVTIHYITKGQTKVISAPKRSCKFKRHTEVFDSILGDGLHQTSGQNGMQGKTTIYDVFLPT